MVNIEDTGYALYEHGIVPPEGLGADKAKVDAAKAEGDEDYPLEDVCPVCGRSKCSFAGDFPRGWFAANSWGGSGDIVIGTNNFRKDLPVKVVRPAPRFDETLFWVVK